MPFDPGDDEVTDPFAREFIGLPPLPVQGDSGTEGAGTVQAVPQVDEHIASANETQDDGLMVAESAAGVILCVTINADRPEVHTAPEFGLEIVMPPRSLRSWVRDSVLDLGLEVQELPIEMRAGPGGFMTPEERERAESAREAYEALDHYVPSVPKEALWTPSGQPTALLGAVAEALRDPALMARLAAAFDAVRFGSEGRRGPKFASPHEMNVRMDSGEPVYITESAPLPPGLASVECSCGRLSMDGLQPYAALRMAAEHVRGEVEDQVRDLERFPMSEPTVPAPSTTIYDES